MLEEWRDVKGYEGIYQVSSLGRVKSLDRYREYLLRTGIVNKGIRHYLRTLTNIRPECQIIPCWFGEFLDSQQAKNITLTKQWKRLLNGLESLPMTLPGQWIREWALLRWG